MTHELTRPEIEDLLRELGRRLAAKGNRAEIYLVGGAAMALEINERRVTADIDAVFVSDTGIQAEIEAIADERGLDPGWLNSRAAMFFPGGPDPDSTMFTADGIEVTVASPEYVLAMKMAAFRPGKDYEDLEALFDRLELDTPQQVADICSRVYGDDTVVLPGRNELLLSATAIFDRLRRRDPPEPAPTGLAEANRNLRKSAAATTSRTDSGKVQCPYKTNTGRRCQNQLRPGATCPAHNWTAPAA